MIKFFMNYIITGRKFNMVQSIVTLKEIFTFLFSFNDSYFVYFRNLRNLFSF